MRASLAIVLLACTLCRTSTFAEPAERTYSVAGKDTFSLAGDLRSEVSYSGTQTLRVRRHGKRLRYATHVSYRRSDGAAASDAVGDFSADVLPSGEMVAASEHDPDYLSVLNQPFAAQLDRQTLADLRRMSGALPFDFPAPFGGSSLHGSLRHIGGGALGSRRTTGVRFEAAGPVKGTLPDRPGLALNGNITMRGTAYYDSVDAILLALDSTVTIRGNLSGSATSDAVTITYERKIRASEPRTAASDGRTP